MNAQPQEWVVDNAAWAKAKPCLSVLIPFLNDDPRRLIAAVDAEQAKGVEIVLLDDGGEDDGLAAGISTTLQSLSTPARYVRLVRNEGRSKGRNRLAAHARAGHLLFLDADMLPDAPDFLRRYLTMIEAEDPAVVCGGFSTLQCEPHPDHALHRSMAGRADCAPAEVRSQAPEKYVFTSNLMVRRDVFETERFDEGFKGWGWEDVEWGIRVSRRYPLLHIENPATHLGLDTPEVIAAKYEQSATNFGRVARAHPDVVRTYPSWKAARLLKRIPLRGIWRPALKSIALTAALPLKVRGFSLRLYRAALCAEAV
ncbi:MAG: glycosyltransferase family 2 protein [Caulobacteraceae bacterium]